MDANPIALIDPWGDKSVDQKTANAGGAEKGDVYTDIKGRAFENRGEGLGWAEITPPSATANTPANTSFEPISNIIEPITNSQFYSYFANIKPEHQMDQGSLQCIVAGRKIILERASFGNDYKLPASSVDENIIWLATDELNDKSKGQKHSVTIDASKAAAVVDLVSENIKVGRPVLLGVDWKDADYNQDKITDHWIVGVGFGVDKIGQYIRFYDVINNLPIGTNTQESNKLYNKGNGIWKGHLKGTSSMHYTLTAVQALVPKKL
jgi:hypothetical protein